MPIRTADARWQGTFIEGTGTFRTGKGGVTGNYSASSRFEEGAGSNPEELIGAAHAGCFSMALAKALTDAGFPPASIETRASVHLDKTEAGMTVTRVALDTAGQVPGIDAAEFDKWAQAAKESCPISRLLAPGAQLTVTASLA